MTRRVERRTLQTQVRAAIEEMIVLGTLEPGKKLGEVALSEDLGVSRQPVREALHTLAGLGFVDIEPGRGATVHQPTAREIRETFHVRALLEADGSELAARTIDDAGADLLREICERGEASVGGGDPALLLALNRQFHDAIITIAGNGVSAMLLDQLQRRVAWYLERVIVHRAPGSWQEHREIYEALTDHDGETAHALMLRHVHRTLETIELR